MAVLPIRLWPDPALAAPCAPVAPADDAIRRFAADLVETMYAAEGRGLAAPQVGRLVRVFAMDVGWKSGAARAPRVFVDPEIVWAAPETAEREERCLSIPDRAVRVRRPVAVRLVWSGLDGQGHAALLEGIEAVCVQHECDHLDGRLIVDGVDAVAGA